MTPFKERFQIDIDHHPVAVLHVTLCRQHRIVRTSARPEAVAVFRKRRIESRLHDLQQGLLDQPIRHRRYPKLTHPATGLR